MAVTIDGVGEINGVVLPTTSFGKVLQVVRATDTTSRSTSSTSYVDANISVTITPQKSTSAVLLLWSLSADTPSNIIFSLAITDSSNNIVSGGEGGELFPQSSRLIIRQTIIAYATPATTSTVTFKGRFKVNTSTASIKNADVTGQLYAIEVSA